MQSRLVAMHRVFVVSSQCLKRTDFGDFEIMFEQRSDEA